MAAHQGISDGRSHLSQVHLSQKLAQKGEDSTKTANSSGASALPSTSAGLL